MATTYEPNTKLGKPAIGDVNWGSITWNGNADILEALAPIASLNVSPTEIPSASLNVRIAPGTYLKPDGTLGTYAGATSSVMTASNTNYVYLDNSYALAVSTTSFPAAAFYVPLATVTAGVSTITGISDGRVLNGVVGVNSVPYLPLAGGTLADGANVIVGSTTGTKIGTATTQKLGFYNVTPIIQPAGAGQAAATAQSQTSLTDNTGGAVSTTLAAITAGASYTQADMTATKNALASIAAELALVKTDVTNVKTLEDAIRTALVNLGAIKGAA